MNKNLDLIVHRIGNCYDVMLPGATPQSRLFYTLTPYRGGEEALELNIEGSETVVEDPAPGRRAYFILRTPGRPDVLAGTREVAIPAVENFRDMGGYRTLTGATVKWGRFFRSGPLDVCTDMDKQAVDALGIHEIFDYRSPEECNRARDYEPVGARYRLLPAIRRIDGEQRLEDDMDMVTQLRQVKTREDADVMYQDFKRIYSTLPFENPAYQAMFLSLDNEESVPIVQHCTAGKDRTGVGCAMLLLALGVDRETAMGDYLLSAPCREQANQKYIAQLRAHVENGHALEMAELMLSVRRDMLQTTFDAMDARYDSFESFLRAEYDVTPERLAHWRALHLA